MLTKNDELVGSAQVNQRYRLTWALPTTIFTLKSWENSGTSVLKPPKKWCNETYFFFLFVAFVYVFNLVPCRVLNPLVVIYTDRHCWPSIYMNRKHLFRSPHYWWHVKSCGPIDLISRTRFGNAIEALGAYLNNKKSTANR